MQRLRVHAAYMSGTRRANLLREIVVREGARIDQALGVFDGLLNNPGKQVDSAGESRGAEVHSRSVPKVQSEDIGTIIASSRQIGAEVVEAADASLPPAAQFRVRQAGAALAPRPSGRFT